MCSFSFQLLGVFVSQHRSLSILFISLGYLFSGLLFIPFTVGAFNAYHTGALNSSSLIQLGAITLVLVLIPLILSYTVWKGYRLAWGAAIVFASFNVVLYLITFVSINITLINGTLISSSIIGPLGYAIAYGVAYIGTYLVVIIDITFNIGLIYFMTTKKTKEYFGISPKLVILH